jgi:two-component system chemotaxis sensor kinase CheA
MEALRAGAVSAVEKPGCRSAAGADERMRRLCRELAVMSQVKVVRQRFNRPGRNDEARMTNDECKEAIRHSSFGHSSLCPLPLAPQETVRVSVDSLDRLTRSVGEMQAELELLMRFTRRLDEFQREIHDLERERETIRRAAAVNFVKLRALPELEPLAKHLEHVDRQISMMARGVRQLSVEQRRTAWLVRTRSANIVRGVHEARMVPAHTVFHGFRKLIRDLARSEQKQIELVATGLDVRADRMMLQELKDPLMHVLTNCVTHGVETPSERLAKGKPAGSRVSLNLEIIAGTRHPDQPGAGSRLAIAVEDDGRGVDIGQIQQRAVQRGLLTAAAAEQQSVDEALSLLLEPGFTTLDSATALAGRGMGLSIVQNSVARLQGQVKLGPGSAGGLRVALSMPITVSTHRVLLVACAGQTLAIPTRQIERLLRIPADKLDTLEGQPVVTYRRCPIRLTSLAGLLGTRQVSGVRASSEQGAGGREEHSDSLPPAPCPLPPDTFVYAVLLKARRGLMAASVDSFIEERDALIQPLDEFAAAAQFAGCILLEDRRIALVIQPSQLWDARNDEAPITNDECIAAIRHSSLTAAAAPPKILIVDDSFTTRTLEKSILEAHGYRVAVAVDGIEALSQLRQQKFAAVISDIEMPRMDGFALLEEIRSDRRLSGIPVILVTSRDRQEDQRRGLDLGAEAYIVKRKFDHQELLGTIRQLIASPAERQLA